MLVGSLPHQLGVSLGKGIIIFFYYSLSDARLARERGFASGPRADSRTMRELAVARGFAFPRPLQALVFHLSRLARTAHRNEKKSQNGVVVVSYQVLCDCVLDGGHYLELIACGA